MNAAPRFRRCEHIAASLLLFVLHSASIAQDGGIPNAGLENRLGLTFSPDGASAYWVEWNGLWGGDSIGPRLIYTASLSNDGWSEPIPTPFAGDFNDGDPFVSPDGRWLYFISDRPAEPGDDGGDRDIWRYDLEGGATTERLQVNSDADEYSPVLTASGALYFASAREGGLGQGDLYRAAAAGDEFGEVENLGPAVNSPTGEWNLWVSADESELILEASSRPTNVSIPGDLYYSWRAGDDWVAAVPLKSLNTADSDLMTRLHADGNTLFYTTAPIGGHARIAAARWGELRSTARADYAPTLIVANRSSHEVTFVDLALGRVTKRIATGEGPHLLSNVSDGWVVATGFGEFPEPHAEPVASRPPFESSPNSRFTVIDVESQAVQRGIRTGRLQQTACELDRWQSRLRHL